MTTELVADYDTLAQWIAERLVENSHRIPDFSWFGDEDIGVSWGFVLGVTRDSPKGDKTRYYRAVASFKRRFPDDVVDSHNTHWACGWVDQLLVRMLDEEGRITKAGEAIVARLVRQADGDIDAAACFIERRNGPLKRPRHAPASISGGI